MNFDLQNLKPLLQIWLLMWKIVGCFLAIHSLEELEDLFIKVELSPFSIFFQERVGEYLVAL